MQLHRKPGLRAPWLTSHPPPCPSVLQASCTLRCEWATCLLATCWPVGYLLACWPVGLPGGHLGYLTLTLHTSTSTACSHMGVLAPAAARGRMPLRACMVCMRAGSMGCMHLWERAVLAPLPLCTRPLPRTPRRVAPNSRRGFLYILFFSKWLLPDGGSTSMHDELLVGLQVPKASKHIGRTGAWWGWPWIRAHSPAQPLRFLGLWGRPPHLMPCPGACLSHLFAAHTDSATPHMRS